MATAKADMAFRGDMVVDAAAAATATRTIKMINTMIKGTINEEDTTATMMNRKLLLSQG